MEELIETTAARSDNNESVTFKISVSDKQKLLRTATDMNMTVSEYIRIKLLMEEEDLHRIIKENKELKQKAKESKVRQQSNRASNSFNDSIIIQSTNTGKEVIGVFLEIMNRRQMLRPKGYRESDLTIGCALSLIIFERLLPLLSELDDIREKYDIIEVEQFYQLLFEPYYATVFPKHRMLKFDNEET
jgi:hypothetical protein